MYPGHQVNDVEMTGKTQGEAVSMLRNTPLGSTVMLVVSRQDADDDDDEEEEEQDPRFKVPRPLVRARQKFTLNLHIFVSYLSTYIVRWKKVLLNGLKLVFIYL